MFTGEVSDSGGGGGQSSESDTAEFEDGFGPDMIGDDEDRARLNEMTEKEREQIIFERTERREALKTR